MRKKRLEKFWNFAIFTKSFDYPTWLALFIALVMMSGLEGFSIKLEKSSFHFLKCLSVLISGGTIGEANQKFLFILWMMTCLVISIYYSGDMTSVVISPASEETLRGVEDLEKNNFTLIFSDPRTQNVLNGTVQALIKLKFVHKDITILHKLLQKKSILPKNPEYFIKAFTEQNNVAHVNMWPFAINAANRGNHELLKRGKYLEKKCHVGKLLIPGTTPYLAFLPPQPKQLRRVFQRIQDAGIVTVWTAETFLQIMSRRVQDRAQVISPTMLGKDTAEKGFFKLKLEGQTIVIFFLWGVCLFVSFITVLCEIIYCGGKSYH